MISGLNNQSITRINMASHEEKQCPRCNEVFECKSGTIERCQCHSIGLADFHHDYIHSLYVDCLCAACLTELRRQYNIEVYERKISALTMR